MHIDQLPIFTQLVDPPDGLDERLANINILIKITNSYLQKHNPVCLNTLSAKDWEYIAQEQ